MDRCQHCGGAVMVQEVLDGMGVSKERYCVACTRYPERRYPDCDHCAPWAGETQAALAVMRSTGVTEAVERALAKAPDGLRLGEITDRVTHPRGSVREAVRHLVKAGRVVSTGVRAGTRYYRWAC